MDLFSFLLSVHSGALGKASAKQPGLDVVAGVWKGLHYLVQRFRLELPTDAVKTALPSAGSLRGRRALLQGAVPLPPETLASLLAYVCDPSKPRVFLSWAFALAVSTVSSLRQANTQNVSFYGELHVLGRDYLLSQHADPKSRGRVPTVFVTPLQNFNGSTAWRRVACPPPRWPLLLSTVRTHAAGCPWEQCIELGQALGRYCVGQ